MATTVEPIPAHEQLLHESLVQHDPDADPDAQAAMFLLFRTHVDTVAAMEPVALRPLGLTHAGFVLLSTLWIMGPQQTRHLARVQRVSKPSIVASVDTLERAGLVRRVKSTVDRRLVTVELTPEGARTIKKARRTWHACERVVTAALTAQERRSLARMLRKLDAAVLGGCLQDRREEEAV